MVGSSWGGAATDRVALLASAAAAAAATSTVTAANSISSNLAASHSSDGHSQDITGTGKRPTRPCLQLLSRPEKKPATGTQPKKATKQHKIQSRQLEKANVGKKKESKI